MIILLIALLIGVVAGLRAFSAPAAVRGAAHQGWLRLNEILGATIMIVMVAR